MDQHIYLPQRNTSRKSVRFPVPVLHGVKASLFHFSFSLLLSLFIIFVCARVIVRVKESVLVEAAHLHAVRGPPHDCPVE